MSRLDNEIVREPRVRTRTATNATANTKMDRDSAKIEDDDRLQAVLGALEDADCRNILRKTARPMTATELEDRCEIPKSTLYRKLELLSDASLVRESYEIDDDRGRITRYQRDFERVTFSVADDDQFELVIRRPDRTAETRLAEMWSEMRDEI